MKRIGIGPGALSVAVLTAAAITFAPGVGTSRSAAYAEPSSAAKADTKPAPPAPAGGPSDASKKAFEKLVQDLRAEIMAAPPDAASKQRAAKDVVGKLQKFAVDHPSDPISDSARL